MLVTAQAKWRSSVRNFARSEDAQNYHTTSGQNRLKKCRKSKLIKWKEHYFVAYHTGLRSHIRVLRFVRMAAVAVGKLLRVLAGRLSKGAFCPSLLKAQRPTRLTAHKTLLLSCAKTGSGVGGLRRSASLCFTVQRLVTGETGRDLPLFCIGRRHKHVSVVLWSGSIRCILFLVGFFAHISKQSRPSWSKANSNSAYVSFDARCILAEI